MWISGIATILNKSGPNPARFFISQTLNIVVPILDPRFSLRSPGDDRNNNFEFYTLNF